MAVPQKSAQTRTCYEQLRRRLRHGQIVPGARLVEEKWAAMLKVNRSALREALTILAHEGFLEIGARGGYFVPKLDQDSMEEVLEVRLALEIGALQALEMRGGVPDEDRRLLHQACDLMEQLMEAGFEMGFAEADQKFHEILVNSAGNSRLVRIYRQSPLPLVPLPEPSETARRESMQRTLADHREFCRLLDANEFDEARAFLRRHLFVNHRQGARWLGLPSARTMTLDDAPMFEGTPLPQV